MASNSKKQNKGTLPWGWFMAGSSPTDYQAALDNSVFHTGTRCAHMKHATSNPQGFGTLMQSFSPQKYVEKRLRMSVWIKTLNVEGWSAPWLRVDGLIKGQTLSFDNFCERQIKGTTDWTKYESNC